MNDEHFFLLLEIAKQAGPRGTVSSSTSRLAQALACSQQTISRQLRELEGQHLVRRKASALGVELSLTDSGRAFLRSVYLDLSGALQASGKPQQLVGTVETGLQEGAYYMSLPDYRRQLRDQLGLTPFAGTLNLRVNETDFLSFLEQAKPAHIQGFQTVERSFGGLKAYRVQVNGKIPGALIVPDRTTHKNVAEVVSEKKLRDQLGLKDGSPVTLSLTE